jgi:hypothetical protein
MKWTPTADARLAELWAVVSLEAPEIAKMMAPFNDGNALSKASIVARVHKLSLPLRKAGRRSCPSGLESGRTLRPKFTLPPLPSLQG